MTSRSTSHPSRGPARLLLLSVLALGGCAILSDGEQPADARVADAAAWSQAPQGSPEEDDGAPAGGAPAPPVYEPAPTLDAPDEPDPSGVYQPGLPEWAAWTVTVPEAFGPYVDGERPSAPVPLVERLPARSLFRAQAGTLDPDLAAALASPSLESAAHVALATMNGMVGLVNDGAAEPFATLASTQCEYCLFRLEAATAIHDGGGVQPHPWSMEFDDQVAAWELTGPDHVVVELAGVDHGLAYVIPGTDTPAHVGIPGAVTPQVELMFSGERWWVIEVYAL